MKKEYKKADIKITKIEIEDILLASNTLGGEDLAGYGNATFPDFTE